MRKFAPNFEIIMADLLKTEQQFKDVMSECRTLFEKKLHDYGASWRILRPSSLTDQLYIKAKRIRSLEIKKESLVGEGIRPEFIALINYGIVGLIQLEKPFADEVDMTPDEALKLYDRHAQEALQLMRPGDEWEIYLPPEYAYGAAGKDIIPGNAAMVFRIELLEVTDAPAS